MDDDRADRTLYVGNLDSEVTEDILYELFLQAGPLVSVKRMADKPFAFVEFKHDISVPYAKNIMTGTHLFKKELRLQFRSGSIHQQQSQRQPQNYHRSNSYPEQQGHSPQYQQNINAPQFQGQDPRQAMFYQQQNFQFHGQSFNNGQQGNFQNRNHQNQDFRRSPQYNRTQSYHEQDSGSRGYDSGRSRHHDRGHNDRHRHSGGHNRGNQMRNEPQEIIQKQMRRSAESDMRHSSHNRGQYHQNQESRSGGNYYRR